MATNKSVSTPLINEMNMPKELILSVINVHTPYSS